MSSEKVLIIDLNKSAEYQELLDGQPQTCGMRSGRVYVLPGKTCGRHSTNHHEEVLVFLSGRGLLLIGEKDRLGKGKVSYIPPHTIHDVKNTGTEPLIYIYCVAPVRGKSGEQEPAKSGQ
ncbi:MAG: cupin domain-containing protein [Planctomycetota bacterium]|jgi:mannose-6-phosphate isomerase-like protein (cupin superfamily)